MSPSFHLVLFCFWRVSLASQYLNEWMLEIPAGFRIARQLADDYGFQLVKQLPDPLSDIFVFSHPQTRHRSKRSAELANLLLENDTRVTWFEQQTAKVRSKRDYVHREADGEFGSIMPLFMPDVKIHPDLLDSDLLLSPLRTPPLASDVAMFNDPMWNNQWYLLGEGDLGGRSGRSMNSMSSQRPISLNVFPVWEVGITGKGVVVTILDDGVETNHTDLIQNFDAGASTDLNGDDRDPTPRYDNPEETHHGTRCAGEVAMAPNNNVCGVGIAFNAKIGGIRMLDGTVTDRVEAEAFSFNNNYIQIYSSSWGPSDDGRTVEGPGLMANRAFEKGVTEGRQGKGVLYIWASGNGGINGDSCAYDGYASSIYTLSIGSVTEHAHFPIYGEICASTMAVTYSSGSLKEGKIVSTDILNGCTTEHTGTSASAPLAAGIVALALEANPNLTWRDLKHIVAWSADPFPLLRNPGWSVNGEGLLVSPAFGFGLMDAQKLVKAAAIWKTSPPKVKCVVRKTGVQDAIFTHQRPLIIQIRTQACQGTANEINHLEHVEVIISLSHLKRGAVRIFLESPAGTRALIAPRRDGDFSADGLSNWPFVSVHTWSENPLGVWTLIVESHLNQSFAVGSLHSLRLVFHGTNTEPQSVPTLRQWRAQYGILAQQDLPPPEPITAVPIVLPNPVNAATTHQPNVTIMEGHNTSVAASEHVSGVLSWFRSLG